MSNKVNGLWAVNSDGVFMFFNSVDSPSVWRFGMSDGVESWRMVPGVSNAQAVRGVAADLQLVSELFENEYAYDADNPSDHQDDCDTGQRE